MVLYYIKVIFYSSKVLEVCIYVRIKKYIEYLYLLIMCELVFMFIILNVERNLYIYNFFFF